MPVCCRPFGAGDRWLALFLGLTPQAVCSRPFGAVLLRTVARPPVAEEVPGKDWANDVAPSPLDFDTLMVPCVDRATAHP